MMQMSSMAPDLIIHRQLEFYILTLFRKQILTLFSNFLTDLDLTDMEQVKVQISKLKSGNLEETIWI